MPNSIKKLVSDVSDKYGIVAIIIGSSIIVYLVMMLYNYLSTKGSYSKDTMSSQMNAAYNNNPSANLTPFSANESYAHVAPSVKKEKSCGGAQKVSDLLPADGNKQWANANPMGRGDLNGINLLNAGHHIGIDTIGQSFKNPNLQLRSEPPNPQVPTGPWNQSTIVHDFTRPSLEIGQGPQ